jgi:hypothetical protein
MQHWQMMMNQANQDFIARDFHSAEYYFLKSICESNYLLSSWFDSEKAITAHLCSYHNLAHLLLIQHRHQEAKTLLLQLQDNLNERLNKAHIANKRSRALLIALESNRMALKNNFFAEHDYTRDHDLQ